jgi:hypothetical protein
MTLLRQNWGSSISRRLANGETACPCPAPTARRSNSTAGRSSVINSFGHQPGRCAVNAIFAANHLGLPDGCHGTVIGKRTMQRREVNARFTPVTVNDGGIIEVLAEDKVRCKEAPV